MARQTHELRALADEQRKAGLLLDDANPVRLASSAIEKGENEEKPVQKAAPKVVFGVEDEEELGLKRRRGRLIKLDFKAVERERPIAGSRTILNEVPKNDNVIEEVRSFDIPYLPRATSRSITFPHRVCYWLETDALLWNLIQNNLAPLVEEKLSASQIMMTWWCTLLVNSRAHAGITHGLLVRTNQIVYLPVHLEALEFEYGV